MSQTMGTDPKSLRAATAIVAADFARRHREIEEQSGEPPRLGDVFLSHNGDETDVEWVVLKKVADQRCLQAIPIDDYPLVGSDDLELHDKSLGGAAVARCGITASVRPSRFKPAMRTGRINRFELGRIQRKKRTVEERRDTCRSGPESLVDCDPEYQDRLEEVRQARDSLSEDSAEESTGSDTSEDACLIGAEHPLLGAFLFGEAVQLNERYRLASYLRPPADIVCMFISFVLSHSVFFKWNTPAERSMSVADLFMERLTEVPAYLVFFGSAWPYLLSIVALQLLTLASLGSYRKPWRWVNVTDLVKLGLLVPVALSGGLLLKLVPHLTATSFFINLKFLVLAGFLSWFMMASVRLFRRVTYLTDERVNEWREQAMRAPRNDRPESLLILTKKCPRKIDLDLVDAFVAQPEEGICHVLYEDDTYVLHGSFSHFAKCLDPEQFLIANDTALNTSYFKRLRCDKSGVETMDGRIFPMSESEMAAIAGELRGYGMNGA